MLCTPKPSVILNPPERHSSYLVEGGPAPKVLLAGEEASFLAMLGTGAVSGVGQGRGRVNTHEAFVEQRQRFPGVL